MYAYYIQIYFTTSIIYYRAQFIKKKRKKEKNLGLFSLFATPAVFIYKMVYMSV